MARKGFITTGTQHFPHVQVVAAFPSLPPGSEPWGKSRHLSNPLVSTHQASTARFIWKLSHLQPYLFFLIPATLPQPSASPRQLRHLAGIKLDGAWDITGFYSHPCKRAGSVELTATSVWGSIYLIPFLPRKGKKKTNNPLQPNIWELSPPKKINKKKVSLGAEHHISLRQSWTTAMCLRAGS